MDTAATLALLLDRGVGEAGDLGTNGTSSAILDEAACFAEAGWRETALLIKPAVVTTSTPRSTRFLRFRTSP
jgi:hypothetical protein